MGGQQCMDTRVERKGDYKAASAKQAEYHCKSSAEANNKTEK